MKKKREFKRVPAVYKCFHLLELFAHSERPLFISEIARTLNYSKSTVYNLVHTLADLGVLEYVRENRFRFGVRLYALGKSAGHGSELISTIHPYLEEINRATRLSVFLGIRSGGGWVVVVDKVDSPEDVKVSSEIGMTIPLLAGAGGKVLLSQISDVEINEILSENSLRKFTPSSCASRKEYMDMINKARQEKFAFDDEEYIEGIRAFASPLYLHREDLQASIWAVGLKSQIRDEALPFYKSMMAGIVKKIETCFSLK